ncbi:MAG: LysE family translocator [Kiritimatiellia bacterium]
MPRAPTGSAGGRPAARRLWAFFLVSLALGIAPGPDILFVLAQSMAQGWRAGSLVTLGLCTGLVFHVSLAAFGVAACLKRHPRLFRLITWCGAAYLAYLGVEAWRSAPVVAVSEGGEAVVEALPALRLYTRGVVMNALNPKVMLFFLALMPQFVVPERGRVAVQFLMLGGVFAVSTVLVFHVVALCGGFVAGLLDASSRAAVYLCYSSAFVMFGIAGWIAWRNLRD